MCLPITCNYTGFYASRTGNLLISIWSMKKLVSLRLRKKKEKWGGKKK